jgi:hypothetical protein
MTLERQSPGGDDVGVLDECSKPEENARKVVRTRPYLKVRVVGLDRMCLVHGRLAQTLWLLRDARPKGLTSGDASPLGWARRTSHYVFKLRALGLDIATTRELISDGARIGRYRLKTPLDVIDDANGLA